MPDFSLNIHVPVQEISIPVDENPLVSVVVLTYNQEKFIEECIISILKQHVNFSFEIIVGEDASIDNTRRICTCLQQKYPEQIRLFLHHTENKIKDTFGNPTGKFNLLYSIAQCKGKYIAICEGDDYWTDPLKLRKQVDFLENNADYVAVFTDYDKLYHESGKTIKNFNAKSKQIQCNQDVSNKRFFSRDLKLLRTLTSIYRSEVLKDFKFLYLDAAGDTQWIFTVLQRGKIFYLNESTGVYRIQRESTSKSDSFDKRQRFLENYTKLLEIIKNNYALSWFDRRYVFKTILIYQMRNNILKGRFFLAFVILIRLYSNGFLNRAVMKNFIEVRNVMKK